MKHIKPYKIFESQEPENPPSGEHEKYKKERIHVICNKYGVKNYTINDDLTIDVDGNVDLSYKELKYIPVKFNKVTGHFNCANNELTSLKGSPEEIGGNFICYVNKLTTLEGVPNKVVGVFNCSFNKLTSLQGGPVEVGLDYHCTDNEMISLKGAPHTVGKGDEGFDCSNNYLRTLEHLPITIFNYLFVFAFDNNPIFFLTHTFLYKDNGVELLQEFNDYDIVRGDKVVLNRLKIFINDFDLEMPNLDEVKKHYKVV